MASEHPIHKHTFWLYGVLVGVSIKEALETSVSHLVNPDRIDLSHLEAFHNFPHPSTGRYPEIMRLAVFLVLIIRFYLGTAYYFGVAYESRSSKVNYPVKNYGVDFMFGFFRFASFVVLALLMDIHTNPIHGFPYLVGFILLYDALWWVTSLKRSTKVLLFWWAAVNVITVLFGGFLYVIWDSGAQRPITAEVVAFWVVIIPSLFDIALMMVKRPFFRILRQLVPPDLEDDISETPDAAEPIPE